MKLTNTNLWTATVTPFTENGKHVDYTSYENVLKIQADNNNGILLLGSTGESFLLKEQEKRDIVKFACSLNLQVPIIVGVPNTNLYQALEWIDFCNSQPLAAYLLTTPVYTKPGIRGQIEWFTTLFKSAEKPIMLYNVPSRTGTSLVPEVIAELETHKNFWSLKEASGSIEMLITYSKASPAISIFCGDDNLLPCVAPLGAKGLVSVASNVWPIACKKYVEYCLNNKFIGNIWWQACKALFTASNPVPVKALLKHLNIIKSNSVRLPLSATDLPNLQALIDANQLIQQWYLDHEKNNE